MAPCDVIVLPMGEDLGPAIGLATQLRQQGIRVQLYTEQKKFKAKMQYANKMGIPFAALLGEDEIAAGTVSLKNLNTGVQEAMKPEDAAERIKQTMALANQGAIILE